MKLKCLLFSAVLLSSAYSFAQKKKTIDGNWSLVSCEVFKNGKVLHDENSFFGNYAESNETLNFENGKVQIVLGGETYSYTYSARGHKLLLTAESNALYNSGGNSTTYKLKSVGSTEFLFEFKKNQLIIRRDNQTFAEKYVFVLA